MRMMEWEEGNNNSQSGIITGGGGGGGNFVADLLVNTYKAGARSGGNVGTTETRKRIKRTGQLDDDNECDDEQSFRF